jgi:hypothetical protein
MNHLRQVIVSDVHVIGHQLSWSLATLAQLMSCVAN